MKRLKMLLVILLLASTTACGSAETNKSITASSTQGTQRSSEQNALRRTNNTLSEILLGKNRTVWYQVRKPDKSQEIYSIYVFENGKLWRISPDSYQWERDNETMITLGDITKLTEKEIINKFTKMASSSFDHKKQEIIDG